MAASGSAMEESASAPKEEDSSLSSQCRRARRGKWAWRIRDGVRAPRVHPSFLVLLLQQDKPQNWDALRCSLQILGSKSLNFSTSKDDSPCRSVSPPATASSRGAMELVRKKVTGTQEPNCPLPNSACFVVLLTSQAAQHSIAAAGELLVDLTTSINLHWTFSLPNQKVQSTLISIVSGDSPLIGHMLVNLLILNACHGLLIQCLISQFCTITRTITVKTGTSISV